MRLTVFPLMCFCVHYYDCLTLKRHPIGDRSLSAVNLFLDSMAKEARNILSQLCPDHIQLNQQVSEYPFQPQI